MTNTTASPARSPPPRPPPLAAPLRLRALGLAAVAATAASLALNAPTAQATTTPQAVVKIDAGATGERGAIGGRALRTSARIAGTAQPRLFQTQRVGARGYELRVATPGAYSVKLLLAETQVTRGRRVFDVLAEGRTAVRHLDVAARAGRNRALVVTFPATVTDGSLSLRFRAVRGTPAVAGIEVALARAFAAPTTTTTAPAETPAETPAEVTGPRLYVSPAGSDAADGSQAAPLRTIQAALDRATAGTTINLAAGTYRENVATVASGTADAPITIQGPEHGLDPADRGQAVLTATSRVLSINHSYIHLRGFTIYGQPGLLGTEFPADYAQAEAFKTANRTRIADSKLVYVGAADSTRDLTGIELDDMYLTASGGECVRLRNGANHNRVTNSLITWCGLYGKDNGAGTYEWHNGEAVYVGTSPKSTGQPMHANDPSAFNVVSGNTIHTYGSECFNVKENAHDNTFSGNDCAGNREPGAFYGSNLELRGFDNTVTGNRIHDSAGFGLKLAADSTSYHQGGNVITGNSFKANASADVYNKQTGAQGTTCGNQSLAGALTTYGTVIAGLTAAC